ncbi:MAG TPA: type II toxin-antitoxin system VapC family toxin [Afifellaceae bacterium]|nr:type II toxin-antitoxin system VapC family toxin [Afifellaceae bacterium]
MDEMIWIVKQLDAPLLFKGDDFGLTDIRSAVAA